MKSFHSWACAKIWGHSLKSELLDSSLVGWFFSHPPCWCLHVARWCPPTVRHMPGTSPAMNQEQPPLCPVQAHHHSVEKETTGLYLAAHRSCVAHRHGLPGLCHSSFQISNVGETSDRNVYCQLLRNLKSVIMCCFLPQGAQCQPDWGSSSYHGIPSAWLS